MASVATSRLNKEYQELQRNAAKRQAVAVAAAMASAGGAAGAGGATAGGTTGAPASASTVVATKLPPGRTSLAACQVSDFDADDSDIILYPTDTSAGKLFHWTAFITGPPDSPFENARFQLKLQVPTTYPHSPPKVHFVTRVFHPNVHWPKGEICLDILKDAWTPIWTLETTCRAVIFLLANPAADSPLNCDAGNLVRCGDARGYYSLARSCAVEHAHFQPKYCPPALSVVALTAPRRVAGAAPTAAAAAAGAAAPLPPPEGKHQADAASGGPAFVQSEAAQGNATGGSAPSAPGSSLANTFVYLSQPLLSANATAATAKGAGAAAALGAAASAVVGGGVAQHKTPA